MNTKKRGFELAAGIIGIVASSILILIYLFMLSSVELIDTMLSIVPDNGLGEEAIIAIIEGVIIFYMLLNVPGVILGALMCPTGKRSDGTMKSKKAIIITFIVFISINLLLSMSYILLFLAFATSLTFAIISLCMKHNNRIYNYSDLVSNNVNKQEETMELNNETTVDANNEVDDIETLLAKNKELRDSGAISEETYKEEVAKILSKL